MDIRCPKCGEPWDLDSLHDAVEDGQATDYRDAQAKFRREGCGLWGVNCERDDRAATIVGALMDLAGDDFDGFASDLEDAEFFGLL